MSRSDGAGTATENPDRCGTAWGYAKGHHCNECRRARRIAKRARDWRRMAERVLVDGRWIHPNSQITHGKRATYVNWGCRCMSCCAANTEAMRVYRGVRDG
jgi:hypothetical protein